MQVVVIAPGRGLNWLFCFLMIFPYCPVSNHAPNMGTSAPFSVARGCSRVSTPLPVLWPRSPSFFTGPVAAAPQLVAQRWGLPPTVTSHSAATVIFVTHAPDHTVPSLRPSEGSPLPSGASLSSSTWHPTSLSSPSSFFNIFHLSVRMPAMPCRKFAVLLTLRAPSGPGT